MRACDVTEDERLDRLLAIMNDESQPPAARMEAAKAALPLCHTPIPPKHIQTTDEDSRRRAIALWAYALPMPHGDMQEESPPGATQQALRSFYAQREGISPREL